MFIVGLTGGMGSGKTTVATLFSALGVPVLDADRIARVILSEDSFIREKIIHHFGPTILGNDDQVDRVRLRNIIFEQEMERKWLETLLHPLIIEQIKQKIAQFQGDYCVVEIPLLAEIKQAQSLVDRILVIDVPESIQIKQIIQRAPLNSGMTEADIKKILFTQATRAQRLSMADDVIHRVDDLEQLKHTVYQLHQAYIRIAARLIKER